MTPAWSFVGYFLFLLGGLACAAAAALAWHRRAASPGLWVGTLAALSGTGVWSLVAATVAPTAMPAQLAEAGRNFALLWLLYRLYAHAGRAEGIAAVRAVIWVLGFVALLQAPVALLEADIAARATVAYYAAILHMLGAIGALVLLHNFHAGSLGGRRSRLVWPIFGLAQLWIWDLNLYTTSFLSGGRSVALTGSGGLTALAMAGLLGIGALGGVDSRFKPSRAATFQSISLVLIGLYLLVMLAVAQSLSHLAGGFGGLAAIGLVFAITVLGLIAWPSARLRGWAKLFAARHLFQHRYDYRAEWLRFTHTIGRGDDAAPPLEERVIRVIADITDSTSGLLLLPGEGGECEIGARWQWPALTQTAGRLPPDALSFFEHGGVIIELDSIRRGGETSVAQRVVPAWLRDDPRAWALVPLLHFGRLIGVVALGRPPCARALDWEDRDLLRIAGCQAASYLAEHAGQEALLEASRFDEFNRRIAFVIHDIKNLSSQLSLLGANAERHAENPAFRADMLVTLRNSADKLNGLLNRLSRYGGNPIAPPQAVPLGMFVRDVVSLNPAQHRVLVGDAPDCRVQANPDLLEQVLIHLIQNAVDASPAGAPVMLRVYAEGLYGCVEVVDSGPGMSAEFIRSRLFKPFVSSKPGGFGIGAFEAREHVRAMNGRLDVDSREGIGSRMTVRLPLAAAAELVAAIRRDEAATPPPLNKRVA